MKTGLRKAWETRGHGEQRHRRHPVTAHVSDRDQRHRRHCVAQGVEELPHRGGVHDAALSQPVGGVAGCDAEEPQSEVGQCGEDAVGGELKFEDVFHVGRKIGQQGVIVSKYTNCWFDRYSKLFTVTVRKFLSTLCNSIDTR